jgi:hypothetical protein
MQFRMPDIDTPKRPDHDGERTLYLRSYLLMRMVIGFVGMAMPLAVFLGDRMFATGPFPRSSVSAYYNSGMRDLFVGSLCAIAVFLVTYMFFHYNWDNLLSIVAGCAALGVAFFPTGGGAPPTPLQAHLGESRVATVHATCATIFILSLAVISVLFGRREGTRTDRTPAQQRRGRMLHGACAAVMVAAVVCVFTTSWLTLFWGEAIADVAFGVSWFVKGFELDVLLDRKRPGDDPRLAAELVAVR